MDKEFKNKLSQNLHLHFGYFYDQNGKKIKPDEIVTWFEKQEQPIKSVAPAIVGDGDYSKGYKDGFEKGREFEKTHLKAPAIAGDGWVKASERLPEIGDYYYVKIDTKQDSILRTICEWNHDWDYKGIQHFSGLREDAEVLEWLDESQPKHDSAGSWISVNDKLPNDDETVLIFDDNSVYVGGYGWVGTHWMPLPTPPESQKED